MFGNAAELDCTSALKRHNCRIIENQTTLTHVVQLLVRVKFVNQDLRPFHAVGDIGFISFRGK